MDDLVRLAEAYAALSISGPLRPRGQGSPISGCLARLFIDRSFRKALRSPPRVVADVGPDHRVADTLVLLIEEVVEWLRATVGVLLPSVVGTIMRAVDFVLAPALVGTAACFRSWCTDRRRLGCHLKRGTLGTTAM